MTESGLKNTDPLIVQFKSKQRDSIKSLHEMYHHLSLEMINKEVSNNPQYMQHYQNKVNQHIIKINDILTKHERKSIKKFTYENPAEMMKTQTILIHLGLLLEESYREFDDFVVKNVFKCLRLILEREEFYLQYIGFQENSQIAFNEQRKERLLIATEYQKLLYKVLAMVLELLKQSVLSDIEKKFFEFYLAYAFFRVS